MRRFPIRTLLTTFALPTATVLFPGPLRAQQTYAPQSVTAQDYARAEQFLRQNTGQLVFGTNIVPNWIPNGRFWYRNTVPGGHEFIMVDPDRRRRDRAFDHDRLADAISAVAAAEYGALTLPFQSFQLSADGRSITFDAEGQTFSCSIRDYQCTSEPESREPEETGAGPGGVESPDGTLIAFIRDHNLWVREADTGAERQLTADGVEDFGYATDNAGWTRSDRPVLSWSPDSRKIATFQHDGRGVGMMYLTSINVGHPELDAWRYPLPEDTVIFRIHRVVIDVPTGQAVRLQMPPDQHRSTTTDHVRCRGAGFCDVRWAPDASQLAFISSSRDHKEATLRVADANTGAVRDILHEKVETFFESGATGESWAFLPESNEVIWYSQRTDWGHLYLYDLQTGALKRQITSGDWAVLQLHHVDQENRTAYFTGGGKEPGDPYFQYFYSVGLDGGEIRLLTPDSANHTITLSPEGEHFVDAYSIPVDPGATVVRDMRGRMRVELEEGDVSELVAMGWQPPIPFSVKARDEVTDLYGLMYRPTDFDPSKKYPIINYIYPGPQTGSVGSRSFAASRGENQALAELGFIVVQLDAMGTPMRSKSFHAAYYGNMGDNGLPDQIAGMKQLVARYPWIDLDRVGIFGHSGGGFASTDAILRYPDFFHVAVSGAGNHDNRNYEDDWGEKWQGLLVENPDGTTNYDNQANQLLAGNLKGKLLITHGTADGNVPYYNTMLVVNELIAANKDFDLILFPNRGHGYGGEPYMVRRRWDYFVEHLLGATPPKEYEFETLRRPPMRR